MEIIDHGEWVPYKPDDYPIKGLPPNVLYTRRVSDGKDWYLFQRSELTGEDTIKMTIDAEGTVQATATDASMLFPAGMRLIEVIGATEHHETFRQKVFDLRKRGGSAFGPARPDPVMRYQLLIALHDAGLLEEWDEFLLNADRPIQLALEAERLLAIDDRYLRAAADELGWDQKRLLQLFEAAKES